MTKKLNYKNIDTETCKLIFRYTTLSLKEGCSEAIALAMSGLCYDIIHAGVGLYEYDFETLSKNMPHIGGIGLYFKAAIGTNNKKVQSPVIYLVRGTATKDDRMFLSTFGCTKEKLVEFMRRANFPLYELSVLAHEFGHHIHNTKNPQEVILRDKAWLKYVTNLAHLKALEEANKLGLNKKAMREVKKLVRKNTTYVSNKERDLIYQDEKKAWCEGYDALKTLVSTYKIENAQLIFEFFVKCRDISLKNYIDSLWPPQVSLIDKLVWAFGRKGSK